QPTPGPLGTRSRRASPGGPARGRAYGSRKWASGRSVSSARYIATHNAVSETCSIVPDPADVPLVSLMRSSRLLRLPHADRHDDNLHPAELQAALDRECRLVMERAGEEILALEHQLAGEHHRPAELLDQIEADRLQLRHQIG